jgi:7-cyano-7-deazaguanine synthase
MTSDRALVLLSGGIDSAAISIRAAAEHSYIHFLTFDYRQANRKELACAKKIGRILRQQGPHTLLPLDLSASAKSGRSGLLSPRSRGKNPYGYYVPGRNMIFLAHAAAIAETNDIGTIYIGSNLQDAAGTPFHGTVRQPRGGYPDSSREFLRLAEAAINKGLKYASHVRLKAPLLAMNKFEAIRYGYDRKFDFRLTWSCYRNGAKACGTCPACRARMLNFHWAGLVDPVSYELPYTTALSRALDLRARGGVTIGSSTAIRGMKTLRIAVGLPGDTEAGIVETLRRAYFLRPKRVRLTRFAGESGSGSVSPAEIERLWHICNVSADSYNYWKQLGEKRISSSGGDARVMESPRRRAVRSERDRLHPTG